MQSGLRDLQPLLCWWDQHSCSPHKTSCWIQFLSSQDTRYAVPSTNSLKFLTRSILSAQTVRINPEQDKRQTQKCWGESCILRIVFKATKFNFSEHEGFTWASDEPESSPGRASAADSRPRRRPLVCAGDLGRAACGHTALSCSRRCRSASASPSLRSRSHGGGFTLLKAFTNRIDTILHASPRPSLVLEWFSTPWCTVKHALLSSWAATAVAFKSR